VNQRSTKDNNNIGRHVHCNLTTTTSINTSALPSRARSHNYDVSLTHRHCQVVLNLRAPSVMSSTFFKIKRNEKWGALFYSPVDFTDASDLNTLMQVWCIGEINRWIKQCTHVFSIHQSASTYISTTTDLTSMKRSNIHCLQKQEAQLLQTDRASHSRSFEMTTLILYTLIGLQLSHTHVI